MASAAARGRAPWLGQELGNRALRPEVHLSAVKPHASRSKIQRREEGVGSSKIQQREEGVGSSKIQ